MPGEAGQGGGVAPIGRPWSDRRAVRPERHPCPELLERDDSLALLRAALARGLSGQGGLVTVSGEAGIGKTSLLRAFTADVGARVSVLLGACEDLLTPRPLGALRDMFRDAGLPPPKDVVDRDQWIDALLAVFAGHGSQAGTASRPLVIVVEDVHWADDATLDVIRYLGRRVERWPVLLVLSYRDEVSDRHPLQRVLGDLPAGSTTRVVLMPLSKAAVTACATKAGRDAVAVHRATGGNPFYLSEVLASPDAAVSPTVRDAVIARIRRLPENTQEALELLSVIPHAVHPSLVDGAKGLAVLEPAERAGIVEVTDNRVGFRHELARHAVEGALPPSRRIQRNLQVLRTLELTDADPSRLAHHAVAAADGRAIACYAPAAAIQAAAANAHHEALAFARQALRHSRLLPAGRQAGLHATAADALYALNRFGEAAAEAQSAVRCHRQNPEISRPIEFGKALLLCARMQTMVGRRDEARAAARQALTTLEPLGASPELAHAYGLIGNLEAIEARNRSAARWCRRSTDMARALQRPDIEAHALLYLGVARTGTGDPAGMADLKQALHLAAGVRHHEFHGRAAATMATVLIWQGRHPDALPYLEIAERVARDHRHDYQLFHTLAQRCHVDIYAGHWEAAEGRLRELCSDDQHDPAAVLTVPLALLARLQARRTDDGQALAMRAWELAFRSRQVHRMAIAGGARIEEAWLRGDVTGLQAIADALLPMAERANLSYLRGEILRYLRRVGVAANAFGDCPDGFARGIVGDWKGAAAAWATAGNPYEEALELCEAPDPGIAFTGIRRLDELGAVRTADVMRRELLRRGMRGAPRGRQPATRQNPGGLTPRQFAILTLLGDRLTSAEIAERLCLSRRTVDNHVNAILARLAVPSRRQAVKMAIERGWVQPARSVQPI
jgi:DNA-binding CsgD family transcriptional regulator/tetratricopeptide (TPR) repeat protein